MIIKTLIRKPISTLIIFIIVMVFGLMLSLNLPIELLPSIQLPVVSINTRYTNASPQEVEDSVTKPIESVLRGIENLDDITSYSTEGMSRIIVHFQYGSDIDTNVNNIRERLDNITRFLPDDVNPSLYKVNTDDIPIAVIGISANRSSSEIRQITDDTLDALFQQIPGVAYTETRGGEEKKVYVNVNLYKLKEYGLSLGEITQAIRLNGQRASVGSVETDVKTIGLLLDTKFSDINALRNLVISVTQDNSGAQSYIRLSDVAEVYNGFSGEITDYRFVDGLPIVEVAFFKQSGTNVVQTSDNVLAAIKDFENASPADFKFTVIEDNSAFVRQSIKAIVSAVISGAFLAILILIIFLRNAASVSVIAISLPSSIITTLMIMFFFDQSLNIMTMAGLVLGIGMLVDNSIVVLENIYLKRTSGVRLIPASLYGAIEMTRPIFASTMTTVLVFLPILIFKSQLEMVGALFTPLALTIVASLLASFFVAAFLLPVITSRYIPINPIKHSGWMRRFDIFFEKILATIITRYEKTLYYLLKRRKRFIFLIFAVALSPILLTPLLKVEFFPAFKPEGVSINIDFPSGSNAQNILDTMNNLKKEIAEANIIPPTKYVKLNARGDNDSGGITYIFQKAVQSEVIDGIRTKITNMTRNYVGVSVSIEEYDGGGGPPGGAGSVDFSVEVKSDDYVKLLEAVETYKTVIQEMPGLTNVQDSQPNQSFQYTLNVDTVKANLNGINITSISDEIQSALGGVKAATFTEGAKERDIYVQLRDEDRKQATILAQLDVKNKNQKLIPISNFMSITPSQEIKRIQRKNFRRTISITADLVAGQSISQVVAEAKSTFANIPKDDDVIYEFAGTNSDLQKTMKVLLQVFLIAILFVFGIMASQFESFLDPFIIIFTIPLTLFGVILIYLATNYTMTSFSFVGVVVLAGVAVNHGIVMIDYMNLLRKRGVALLDATIEASTTRLQPILMTTLTTVLGLLPTALLDLTGTEFIRPIALTVVGGLSTSAVLSLFLMPLMYYSFNSMSLKRKQKRLAKKNKKFIV